MSDSTGTASGPGSLGDDAEPDAHDLDRDDLGRSGSAALPTDGSVGDDVDRDGDLRDDLDGDLDDDERDGELAPVGAVAGGSVAVAGAGAAAASAGRGATATRSRGPAGRVRSIGTFYRQVVAELRKVIWPTRKELLTYTSVVIVFVLVMVAIVSVFDFAFSQAVLRVFGDSSL